MVEMSSLPMWPMSSEKEHQDLLAHAERKSAAILNSASPRLWQQHREEEVKTEDTVKDGKAG